MPTVIVRLTLHPEAEPIAGEVAVGDGPGRPFVGWLALMRAVESAIEAATGSKVGQPTAGGPQR